VRSARLKATINAQININRINMTLTFMPAAGFEPTISGFIGTNTVDALDRAVPVIMTGRK
jgi:hypothetical protein